jgi:hypothetical protein
VKGFREEMLREHMPRKRVETEAMADLVHTMDISKMHEAEALHTED